MEKLLIKKYYYDAASSTYVIDSFNDRLNNRLTVICLLACISVIVGSLYIGKPINCWTPAEFKGQHDSYANNICWLRGTYYLPWNETNIPDRSKPRVDFVAYYQWTGFILLGMALLFFLPRIYWNNYLRRQGLHLARVVQKINNAKEHRNGIEEGATALRNLLIDETPRKNKVCNFVPLTNGGIAATYIALKLYYVFNSAVQFLLLNVFLSFDYGGYGFEFIRNRMSINEHYESRRFPRVTMCDFMVRRLGSNQHWYAVQCTLPINLYNEIIFFAIWCWLIIITILNIISLIWTTIKLTRISDSYITQYTQLAKDFVTDELGPIDTNIQPRMNLDGALLLELLAKNTNDSSVGEIFYELSRIPPPPKPKDK